MNISQRQIKNLGQINYFIIIDVPIVTKDIKMIEYCKLILQKVSFSPVLFEKELKKALNFINEEDRLKFICWCKSTFGTSNDIIHQYEMIHCKKS